MANFIAYKKILETVYSSFRKIIFKFGMIIAWLILLLIKKSLKLFRKNDKIS